jgi:hypothetical protein
MILGHFLPPKYPQILLIIDSPLMFCCQIAKKIIDGMGPIRVDVPVSKHLRTQSRFIFHTLFLCFESSKNICSPPPSASNTAKSVQFSKGMA